MENPELKLFRDTTRQLLAESPARSVQAADASFDPTWWTRAADLGWTALLAPEEFGGGSITGSQVADLVVLAREFGRCAAPGPLFPVSTVLAGLVESGATATHGAVVENLVAGKTVATWVVSGDGPPHAVPSDVTAERGGDGYVLNGRVERVEAAPQAEVLLVPATTADGVVQLLVPAGAAGVDVTRARSIDMVRQYGTVTFADARVASDAVVGDAKTTAAAIERQWQIAVLLRCAETVGVIGKAFDITLAWAFERYSFGRPLASYQALKHRFADMALWSESCQAITDAAALAVQNRTPDARALLSAAKSYVGQRGVEILQDCVQLHGGIGVTWEHDLHLYLRRAALNANTFGTPDDHALWLAAHVEAGEQR